MEFAEPPLTKFDNYAQRLGKTFTVLSVLLALLAVFGDCGSLVGAFYSLLQIPVLLVLLWLPLLWRRIKKIPLANEAANWVLIASASVFAVLLLSMLFDNGKSSCFR
ncbi:MAG: hypothetical protein ABI769_02980 [Pseudomonadota bacterium]